MIREATLSDIPDLVRLHLAALPGDLLPRLGEGYLSQVFYPTVLGREDTFITIFEKEGKPQAFVIYTQNPTELTHQIAMRKFPLALALLKRIPRHPGLIREILAHAQGVQSEIMNPPQDLQSYAELYLIGTSPSLQGQGIGSKIAVEGLQILKSENKSKGCLVKTSSQDAERFYTKLGFEKIGVERRGQRKLTILAYPFRL